MLMGVSSTLVLVDVLTVGKFVNWDRLTHSIAFRVLRLQLTHQRVRTLAFKALHALFLRRDETTWKFREYLENDVNSSVRMIRASPNTI